MNQIVKLFTSIIPINICPMNENKLTYSTTSLVSNNENDLTTDLVNQIIQPKCLFQNKIKSMNWQNV